MSEKKQHFAIDLDGTLLQYSGWKGEHHFGDPIAGAITFVRRALEYGHEVTVFTTRTNFDEVSQALQERGFPKLAVTNIKSSKFSCFIDDRAVGFDGDDWEHYTLENFRPWWQKIESPE